MDVVIPHNTILKSLTDLPIRFAVQVSPTDLPIRFAVQVDRLTIPSLKPFGKKVVNSSKILKISRHHESESWLIEVFINERFSGLKLEAKHFLDYCLIKFELQRFENEKYILVAEGVKAKFIDTFILRMGRGIGKILQRNRIWKKRKLEVIAKAPPEYARTRHYMRSNVDAINPEATIDSNTMTSPPRKPQAEFNISQDSVKHKEVNP